MMLNRNIGNGARSFTSSAKTIGSVWEITSTEKRGSDSSSPLFTYVNVFLLGYYASCLALQQKCQQSTFLKHSCHQIKPIYSGAGL